jgi:hypothetical protein
MLLEIILIILILLLGLGGFALIHGGQYLYKEKAIKSGLRQAFYNSNVSDYAENKQGRKLLMAGQICVGIAIALLIIEQFYIS